MQSSQLLSQEINQYASLFYYLRHLSNHTMLQHIDFTTKLSHTKCTNEFMHYTSKCLRQLAIVYTDHRTLKFGFQVVGLIVAWKLVISLQTILSTWLNSILNGMYFIWITNELTVQTNIWSYHFKYYLSISIIL